MTDSDHFTELLRRVRAGDQDAATELVRLYEPELRIAVHVRLTDPGLRRLVDSVDICQSVLAGFFLRAAAGQYDLETPQQLLKLLATMARNKIVDQHHKQRAARRDQRRNLPDGVDDLDVAADQTSPSSVVANQELLQEFRRLTDEERRLADGRAGGKSWKELADEVGGQPNAVRMRLERAVDRVLQELGVED